MSKDNDDKKSQGEENQIDPKIIMQSNREVRHAIAYLRMYHYLSSLQAVAPLETTLNGALIMPHKVMGSLGFGFACNQEVFCLHATGFLFDVFSELKPVVANIEHNGLTVKFSELKYADYKLPPIILSFPIINNKVYEIAQSCLSMVITKIEPSLLELNSEEVVEVLNPPLLLQSKSIDDTDGSDKLSKVF